MLNASEMGILLGSVLDATLEGFQVISPEWRYLYVNSVVAEQGQRHKEDLIGRTMMECYPGIELTVMFGHLRQCMEKREPFTMDNRFVFPDGSSGWFQLHMRPVPQGVLILSVDIGERKRVEQALQEKIGEIDALTNVTVGRELRMVELKDEIASLKVLAGVPITIESE